MLPAFWCAVLLCHRHGVKPQIWLLTYSMHEDTWTVRKSSILCAPSREICCLALMLISN